MELSGLEGVFDKDKLQVTVFDDTEDSNDWTWKQDEINLQTVSEYKYFSLRLKSNNFEKLAHKSHIFCKQKPGNISLY